LEFRKDEKVKICGVEYQKRGSVTQRKEPQRCAETSLKSLVEYSTCMRGNFLSPGQRIVQILFSKTF